MIKEFQLEQNSWFQRLYSLKERWCTAFSKDFFSAGMLSSQRSESTNNALGYHVKKTTSLTQFYKYWTQMLENWRRTEEHLEYTCSKTLPVSLLDSIPIIKHAANYYTIAVFQDFEGEFIGGLSLTCKLVLDEPEIKVFDIASCEEHATMHRVYFDPVSNCSTCTCKKMEECGILCSHILRVFNMHGVNNIPGVYLKKRWSKMAKSGIWDKASNTRMNVGTNTDFVPWRHAMARKYYMLLMQCQSHEEARKIMEDGYNRDCIAVNGIIKSFKETSLIGESDTTTSTSVNQVLDPKRSKTKGRSKRVKGPLQGKSRKKQL